MTDTSQTDPELVETWDRALNAYYEPKAPWWLVAARLFVWSFICFWWVLVVVVLNLLGVL